MKRTAEVKVSEFFNGLPVRLRFRNDLHLARKTWHMAMGLFIVLCYVLGTSRSTGVMILASVLGFDLLMEMTRLRSASFNEKILKLWGPLMRAHEVNQMSTTPYYLSSVLLTIAIFPKPVAILSVLYLACGDPIASLFGILYGHRGPKLTGGKTLIGTCAGILACTLVSFIYLKTLSISDSAILMISLLGGIAGGTAELLPYDVDDNFTIPIISGFVVWLAFILIGL